MLAYPVHQRAQHAPRAIGHLVVAAPEVGGLQDFAVHVELELPGGAVPHPHGAGVAIA